MVLPTGAGKSFVALAEMHKYSDQKILYLAPNVEILNQIKAYIRKVYKPEEHLGDKEIDPIKRIFPYIVFDTYQHLGETSAEDIINDKYSLIIFDELHRTGAKEWKSRVENLLNNQDKKVKVLGITATPERDVDLKDMTDYWARYYGYSDEEIIKGHHIAINMDLVEAIRLGYVVNPRVVNCEYSLISDGSLEDIKLSVDDVKDETLKSELSKKYELLRRNVEKSNGIEKILSDNLSGGGKYIVFLPVTKKDGNTYEDADGNKVDKETAKGMIASYKVLIKQYMFSSEYFEQYDDLITDIYNKINSNNELSADELRFLQQEKENILLLSEINIKNKPTSLSTKNNIMIKTIIDYLRWEKFSEIELTKKLNMKMRHKIEDYTMLGSFSDKKNKSNFDSFNNDQSNKVKFMFVMNKLNEGVHVNDIDGIIWLRPLNSTSKILYLQQLGRCIYSINPNVPLEQNKRPVVLDLVNNTLKVKLEDRILQESIDLNKLLLIKSWINSNQIFPRFQSFDSAEKEYAIILNNIHKKYNKYVEEQILLNEMNVERRILIQSILDEGDQIDLWNQPVFKVEKEKIGARNKNYNETLGVLELSANVRDFVELEDELSKSEFESKIRELIQWFKDNQRKPQNLKFKKDCFEDGKIIYSFLINKKSKILSGDYPELLEQIEKFYPSYNGELSVYDIEFEKNVNESIQWFKDNQRMPKYARSKKDRGDCFEDGKNIYGFLKNKKSEILSGDYPELLEQIELYYPSYNGELSVYDIEFEKHVNEAIQWFKDNQRKPKTGLGLDCFEDGTNIISFLDYNKSKILSGDYPKLLEQIELYYPSYNGKLSWLDNEFKKHINETIQWFKVNRRIPKGAKENNKGDCFEDGKNIYDFLRRKKSEILSGDYPELLEQIELYYPSYNSKLSANDIKFKKHVTALIQWFKVNQRAPKSREKGDCFEDGNNIYEFLKHNKSKILSGDYPVLLEQIEMYYPSYNLELMSDDLKLAKIEEIFLRYSKTGIKLSLTLKDLFEIDNTLIGRFLGGQKQFIFEQANQNPHARWIVEQIEKWKKEYESAVQEFSEVSEFSKVMDKMEGKTNETGTRKFN